MTSGYSSLGLAGRSPLGKRESCSKDHSFFLGFSYILFDFLSFLSCLVWSYNTYLHCSSCSYVILSGAAVRLRISEALSRNLFGLGVLVRFPFGRSCL